MSYGRNPECVFTNVFFPDEGEESADAPAYIVPDIPKDATDAEVEAALERKVCPRTTCRLTCGNLISYVMAAGRNAPLDEIAQQVPSDCSWNDVVHDGDRELTRIHQEFLRPPDGV